jgi:ADP-L-glycero-D-manno-heptose 6-epimerase
MTYKTNVCVTGANGFIGSNLASSLCEMDINVLEVGEDFFDMWKRDMWFYKLHELFTDNWISTLYHVGACSDTLNHDVNYMMKINYEATKVLVDVCKQLNIKIIYSSSASIYGSKNSEGLPLNLYAWSKRIAEDYVITNGGVALRYFNVYGPGESHKGRMASVAYQLSQQYKDGKEIKLFPNKPTRDFVYIKDVVDANLYANRYYYDENLGGVAYDVGACDSRSFEDVLQLLDIENYSYHPESMIPEGYQFYTKADKTMLLRNWLPKYPLELGMSEYKKYLQKK